MKLKRVEIQGFKSFVDRTTLDFHNGITAVVGPNGCGKSNLVDAIRWALGETNPRTLRGALMDDVIFSGTEYRPPLGMAEVSITLSNEQGMAPAQYQALPEIMVTRRVFRDGESEYLINKTPCRLKDISDIFMGTGAGLYSVIEQGRIHNVVSAKPDELRTFIEEAAGITFYRSRKRAALRRIEATQKNLIRVSDILSEISRQIRYLERQARKAERYREYRDRLRLLELNLTQQQMNEIQVKMDGLDAEKQQTNASLLSMESKAADLSAQSEALKIKLHEYEGQVQTAQKALFEAGKGLAEKEHQKAYLGKEHTDLGERRVTITSELERLRLKNELIEDELQSGGRELGRLKEDNRDSHIRLQSIAVQKTALEAEQQNYQLLQEENHNKLIEQLTTITTLQSQLAAMQEKAGDQRQIQIRWQQDQQQVESERHQVVETQTQQQQQKAHLAAEVEEKQQRLQTLHTELESAATKLNELESERQQLKEAYTEANSKLESMLALQREEDLSQFMQVAKQSCGRKIVAPISQLITVSKELEKAVEVYLGERLSWVVVKDHPASLMLQILNQGAVPRTTIIPRDITKTAKDKPDDTLSGSGVIGPMAAQIDCSGKYRAVIEYLCGDTVVVDNLQTAVRLSKGSAATKTFVTLNGEIITAGAEVTAGDSNKNYQSILRRKRQIEELRQLRLEHSEKLQDAETAANTLTALKDNLADEKQRLDEDLQSLRLKQVEADKDLGGLDDNLARLQERIRELEQQNSEVTTSHQALTAKMQSQQQQLQQAQTEQAEMQREEARLQQLGEVQQLKLTELQEQATSTRVQNASALEREEHLTQEQLRLKNDLETNRKSVAQLETELQQLWQRENDNRQELDGIGQTLLSLQQQVAELESAFQECQRNYQEVNSQLQQAEVSRRESEAAANQFTKKLSELEIQLREFAVKKEHLRDLMLEKWKVDLTAATPEPVEITAETDEEVERLRNSMDRMGEVNLGAVEEHAFLKERFDFLSSQRDDLEQSLKSLHKTIRKIDSTTRKLFFAAFDGINVELKKMFPRFFQGGKAEILLTGEEQEDPLERGITIMARPPGKRTQHINLLSGGEKALTAAALIFAIFKYKPSPFSILDEVDAPLDDENTRRFNSVAKEISKESQLVIVTHNKTTMEVAQNLYGITMEEAGISKTVSVRLEEPGVRPVSREVPMPTPNEDAAVA